ncbi:MAG: MtrB/PioB family outer membrane beta-barrel protein, partial [Candidatus Aminicenantes bacterium]|nr:MtrB/PioB family outer membrane beta-barrel protein [Candidatus Aminicenantes bacterium]
RATDAPYADGIGGPAQGHNVMAPDNSAATFSLGGMAKFGKSTRLLGDLAMGQWKQNAAFFPYTFNTAVLTADKTPANLTSSLPATSLNGKVETTTVNISFLTRPLEAMYVNVRYRLYDFKNKTPEITSPGYVSWDRSWSTSENTSIPYGYKTGRFETILGWDFGKALALEGAYRQVVNDRTFREAEKTTEKAFSLSAIGHGWDWARLRVVYENAQREASGIESGVTDLHFDLAKRDSQKVGADLELTPFDPLTIMVSYFDRKATYKNPSWGYQSARYTTFTGEVNYQAGPVDATVYYTAEKNKDGHKGYQRISSVFEWYTAMADDQTDSYGGNLKFKIVPDKWDLALLYRYQKVNGFLDLAGSAAVQATREGNGGIQDIPDFDDTSITSLRAQLSYALMADCSVAVGVWHENYTFDDASIQAGLYFPTPGVFMLSPNYGGYKVTSVYMSLSFHL